VIVALEKHQRWKFVAHAFHDPTQDHMVIPTRMDRLHLAKEVSDPPWNKRRCVTILRGSHPGEVVLASSSKSVGDSLLALRQKVDRKPTAALDGPESTAVVVKANKNQRWLERHRGQGVERHAMTFSFPGGSDHRHPGRKTPQYSPEDIGSHAGGCCFPFGHGPESGRS
jgi:hypothetical protein